MWQAVSASVRQITEETGQAWNRFWFDAEPFPLRHWCRFLTGMVALYLHVSLLADMERWLGSTSLLPLEVIEQLRASNLSTLSPYAWLESTSLRWGWCLLGTAVLLCFTFGVALRWTAPLALITVLADTHRIIPVAGPEAPLLILLLIGCVLGSWFRAAPLELRWVQLHASIAYLAMGLAKWSAPGQVWWNGDAAWWIVVRSDMGYLDLGPLLAQRLYLVNLLTHGIPIFEVAMGVLCWYRTARPLMVLIATLYWFAIGLLTGELPLSVLMIAASLSFWRSR